MRCVYSGEPGTSTVPLEKGANNLKLFIGIDCGLSGAVAVIGDGGTRVFDIPTLKVGKRSEIDAKAMSSLMKGLIPAGDPASVNWSKPSVSKTHDILCAIEAQQAFPRDSRPAAFKTGRCFGLIEGCVAALSIPYFMVGPKVWQKVMMEGCSGRGKDASRSRAQALYPDIDLSRKKDHNRSDALLIATFLSWKTGAEERK